MKNLKKVLALVLVVATLMSFATVASATFTDANSINNTEAVDVLSGLGIIKGYTDGSFKPEGNVTRAEMAKMVTMLISGGEDVGALYTGANVFSDCTTHWAKGYIAYANKMGIVAGVGGGKFNPNGNVTGAQAAKMMLVALDYDPAIEGYTGSQWSVNVLSDARDAGLLKGIEDVNMAAPLTRENAAQLMFNTLLATMVKYTGGTNITTSDGTSIVVDAIRSEVVYGGNGGFDYTDGSNGAGNASETVQLCEKYFQGMVATSTYAQGNVKRVVTYKGETISNSGNAGTVLATSANGTSFADLTNASKNTYIGYKADVGGVTYLYQDRAASTTYPASTTQTANESTIQGKVATAGVVVNFIDTDGDNAYDVVSVVEKNVVKLAAAPTTKTTGSVTNVTIPGIVTNRNSTTIEYPADLAKGDVALYYTSQNGTLYVEKATAVSGTISAYNDGTSKVTIDGTTYGVSALSGAPASYDTYGEVKTLIGAAGYTFYLDNSGNICYVVAPDAAATLTNTWLVTAVDAQQSFGAYSYQAKVVDQTGNQQTITVKKTKATSTMTELSTSSNAIVSAGSMADGKLAADLFYTYEKNSDGSYNLTKAANQAAYTTTLAGAPTVAVGDTSYIMKGNTANFLVKVTATGSSWTGATEAVQTTSLGTSSTVFMYYDANAKTYTTYTGIANAQSYAAGGTIYVLNDANGYAQLVIAKGATSSSAVANYDKVYITGGATVTKDADNVNVYSYPAIINGEVDQTYKTYSSTLAAGTLYFSKEYNADKVASASSEKVVGDFSTANTYGTLKATNDDNSNNVIDKGETAMYVNGMTATIVHSTSTTVNTVLGSDVAIYLYDNTDANAPVVMQITPEQVNALEFDATNDTITTVAVSATDSTVAEVYIFID